MTGFLKASNNVRNLLTALVVSMGFMLLASLAALAAENPVPRISVTGEGTAAVSPDLAILSLGVTREAATAREALTQNNAAMREVIDAMKSAGIADEDLQTSNFSIQPRYLHHRPRDGEEQKPPSIIGYTVSNNLAVRIRDLENLGEIIDRSITLGANTGGNIQFGNDRPEDAIRKARIAAMENAREKAETLVEAAGVELGPMIEINENSFTPGPVPMARGRMMAEAAMVDSVPVQGGENTYTVSVSAVWEIAQ